MDDSEFPDRSRQFLQRFFVEVATRLKRIDLYDIYFKLDDVDGFDLQNMPTISPQLRDLINHLTQVQPSDRPQTALEVAEALEQCLP